MTVQLAIHPYEGSFSGRWMAYCDEHKIPYRLVNCLDSDIIAQLASVDALLWHWHHQDPSAQLMARQVIMAAEAMGVAVFPNTPTCWHFDDKVAQKYLLEAVGAPLVPTYVFYDLQRGSAMDRRGSISQGLEAAHGGRLVKRAAGPPRSGGPHVSQAGIRRWISAGG